jgi:DNA-binding NarL/FixJ family response regulator
MIASGARGFVSKLIKLKHLPYAITEINNGLIYIDPILRIKDICRLCLMNERFHQKKNLGVFKLTPKQKEIISLYATSASQQDIAKALSVSTKTLENRVKNVSNLFNVKCRHDLTLNSIRFGIIRVARLFKPPSSPEL